MSYIFLDIDGVLCHNLMPSKYVLFQNHYLRPLDRNCVQRVNKIVKHMNARVVLSSNWRILTPLMVVNDFLKFHGAEFDLYDKTSRDFTKLELGIVLSNTRGAQIKQWLNDNNETNAQILIIDDESDMDDLKPFLLYVRNGIHDGGIQDHHVNQILNKKR